jgi:hypothetical protein
MIDFDVKCRKCGKPMTLRVRDEQARVLLALSVDWSWLCVWMSSDLFRLLHNRETAEGRQTVTRGELREVPAPHVKNR